MVASLRCKPCWRCLCAHSCIIICLQICQSWLQRIQLRRTTTLHPPRSWSSLLMQQLASCCDCAWVPLQHPSQTRARQAVSKRMGPAELRYEFKLGHVGFEFGHVELLNQTCVWQHRHPHLLLCRQFLRGTFLACIHELCLLHFISFHCGWQQSPIFCCALHLCFSLMHLLLRF